MSPIIYARESTLPVAEYIDLLKRSTLAERRPVSEIDRIQGMIDNANLIITARQDGKLVGANRSLTDFTYFCYCSDLAVDKAFQGKGIGSALLDKGREFLHKKTHTFLVSAPDAITFYEHIGLERLDRLFRIPSVNDLPDFADLKKNAKRMTIPLIMGILNITPDSFSDGGKFLSLDAALAHGVQLMNDGADILDIGGESSRPGALPIDVTKEHKRILPVIAALKPEATKRGVKISVDTRNASTMREAVSAGADIINDISALTHDTDSIKVAQSTAAQIVLMHMQGTPQTMQHNPTYQDVVQDVYDYLEQAIADCVAAGIKKTRLIVDPGLGFGKTLEHNVQLLSHASVFQKLGVPVMIGASHKGFLAKLASLKDGQSRLPASLAAAMKAAQQGAQILRVHDVLETKQALTVWQAFGHIDKAV